MKNAFSVLYPCVPEWFFRLSKCENSTKAIIKDNDFMSFIFSSLGLFDAFLYYFECLYFLKPNYDSDAKYMSI